MTKYVEVAQARAEDLNRYLVERGIDSSKLSQEEKIGIGKVLFPNGIEVEAFIPNWNSISRDLLGCIDSKNKQYINPYYRKVVIQNSSGKYTYYGLNLELQGKRFYFMDKYPNERLSMIYLYLWEYLVILPKLEEYFEQNDAWESCSSEMKKKYKEFLGKTPMEMLNLKRELNDYYIKSIDDLVCKELREGGEHLDYVKNTIKGLKEEEKSTQAEANNLLDLI